LKPLSNQQKGVLAQVARRAYDRLVAGNEISNIKFDDWRRDECERAVGKPGLRECDNGHYNRLLSHFESLAGEDGRALNALVREQTEPKRQAEAVLLSELRKANLPLTYAEKLARDKFRGVGVLDCDARQLWQLIYTVRNRAKAKRRASPPPSPLEGERAGVRGEDTLHDSTI
jgi:hypothetical protein